MAMAGNMNGNRGEVGAGRISALMTALSDQVRRVRVYRSVSAELSALSDRELNDLGLSKAMIANVAREAARVA